MKMKFMLNKKHIRWIILLAFLFVLALVFLRSMGAYQPDYKYVFIENNIEAEQIKSKIYIAAENCDSSYYKKISNIAKNDLNQHSRYSIKYGDEVLTPQDIETEEKNGSKIVLCTFNTNEAKRNKIIDFFAYLSDTRVMYQQEKTGIIYCNDAEYLKKYIGSYGKGISSYDKIMIMPISDNVCFFVATQFVWKSI